VGNIVEECAGNCDFWSRNTRVGEKKDTWWSRDEDLARRGKEVEAQREGESKGLPRIRHSSQKNVV